MANFDAVEATEARTSIDSAVQGETKSVTVTYTVPTGATYAATDTISMLKLPAQHVIVDAILDWEAAGGLVVDVGVLGGAHTAAVMTGKDTTAAGNARADVNGFTRIPPSAAEETVGLTVTTGGAGTAGAKVTLVLQYRAANFGA